MKILQGRKIAKKILDEVKENIENKFFKPGLAVILVGRDEASEIYVNLKKKEAEKIGIVFSLFRFSEKSKELEIIDRIRELNEERQINGIIVQLPLPEKFNTQKIINSISIEKDVDGFHPENNFLEPVFPQAVIEMVRSSKINPFGKKAVIVANSEIFGRTMNKKMEENGFEAKYFLAEKILENLDFIKNSDVLISAVGKDGIINASMVKTGAVIIDGGIVKKGKKVLGDVDFESVKDKVSFITPVPGGVGPVTIACLLRNVYLAAKKSLN